MAIEKNDPQIHDQGTEELTGGEVANYAAETLHGEGANVEKREQPDATRLTSDTLIAKPDESK